MKLVADSSFIAAMVLPDEASERIASAKSVFREEGAIAPAICQIELLNILLTSEKRKRINASQMSQFLEIIFGLDLMLEPVMGEKSRADVLRLGHKHALSAYDAAYLELAMRIGAPLATLNASLVRAAKSEAVELAIA